MNAQLSPRSDIKPEVGGVQMQPELSRFAATKVSPAVLTSWKEIAAHLGKGVRTVQRWERELGLPARRPVGVEKHVVIALPAELDEWVHSDLTARQNTIKRQALTCAIAARTLQLRDTAEVQLTLMTRLITDLRRRRARQVEAAAGSWAQPSSRLTLPSWRRDQRLALFRKIDSL